MDSLAIITDGFVTAGGGLDNAYIISWGFLSSLEDYTPIGLAARTNFLILGGRTGLFRRC